MSDDLFSAVPAVRTSHRARGHRVRRIVLSTLILVVAIWLIWLVGFSRVFSVKQIQVSGVDLVSTDDVITASGLSLGQPMARVNSGSIAKAITTNLLEVQSATVTRQFPSTVTIKVTERTPVYQLAVGTQYGLVSADGTVYHVSATMAPLLVGLVPVGNPGLLADVATVVLAIPPDLIDHVQYVQAATIDTITIQLDGDRQVIWGSAEQSELKAQVLSVLLSVKGHVYDVSAPTSPAVR